MNIPVPASEVIRYMLNNEKLSVDGTIALLRKEKIEHRIEKLHKLLLRNMGCSNHLSASVRFRLLRRSRYVTLALRGSTKPCAHDRNVV